MSCHVFYVYTHGLGLAWASFHRYTWRGLHCKLCVSCLQLICVYVCVCFLWMWWGTMTVCVSLCTPCNLSGMSTLLVSWPVVEREGCTNLMINHPLHLSRLMLSNCRAPARPHVRHTESISATKWIPILLKQYNRITLRYYSSQNITVPRRWYNKE